MATTSPAVGAAPRDQVAGSDQLPLRRAVLVGWAAKLGMVWSRTVRKSLACSAWATVWARAAEVLARKLVVAPYTAVMEWVPAARLEVVKVAWPLALRVPVPRVAAPSWKVTVPVGTPAPGATAAT